MILKPVSRPPVKTSFSQGLPFHLFQYVLHSRRLSEDLLFCFVSGGGFWNLLFNLSLFPLHSIHRNEETLLLWLKKKRKKDTPTIYWALWCDGCRQKPVRVYTVQHICSSDSIATLILFATIRQIPDLGYRQLQFSLTYKYKCCFANISKHLVCLFCFLKL